MSEGPFSTKIKEHLVKYAKEKNFIIGKDSVAIRHADPDKDFKIKYTPDKRFETTYRKKRFVFVFEILDSQETDKTIADIIRSFFVPEIFKTIFIVKGENEQKEVYEIVEVLLSRIAKEMGKTQKELPMLIAYVPISEEQSINYTQVKERLDEVVHFRLD
jgi:hypothetical protein